MARTNWANVLTWTRLVLILPITYFAYAQQRFIVLGLFVVAMATDALDGYVARKTKMASDEGALLDSRVDTAMLPFLLVWLWLLFPLMVKELRWLLFAMGLGISLQLLITKWKLGKWTGLHLVSDKASAIIGAASLFALFGFGDVTWARMLFTAALLITIIASIEGITYILKGGKNLDARFFWDS